MFVVEIVLTGLVEVFFEDMAVPVVALPAIRDVLLEVKGRTGNLHCLLNSGAYFGAVAIVISGLLFTAWGVMMAPSTRWSRPLNTILSPAFTPSFTM